MNNITTKKHELKSLLSKQHGASLLEGIAYLGVAAIVILGAISLLGGALGGAQSNRAVEEVIALRTAIQKLYSGQSYPQPNVDITANIINAGAVPGTLRINGNAITNSWNGAVVLTGVTASTFTVSYANVPRDVCVNMVSGATGWNRIEVNGANPITLFPATVANATTGCNAATNAVVLTAT